MADFLVGQQFGVTEQVTNTKLHNMVNLASISNIKASEFASNFLSSLPTTAGTLPAFLLSIASGTLQPPVFVDNFLTSLASSHGKLPSQNFWNLNTPATNASLITVTNFTALNLWYATFGSLATFIGARAGQAFTLIAQQASFPTILDAGSFKLSAAWIPQKQYDNLTLIWDGSVFIETARGNT